MPPANTKTSYKTYQAQARLIRAIVAAHPEVKWNYREIVACFGSDMTEHALNHRFRRLRAQSVIVREGLKIGLDAKDIIDPEKLPITQEAVDRQNIAKYFGQSTADGIQFQFRTIKKDASLLRQVEREGGDVGNCLNLGNESGSPFSTPSKSKSTSTPSRASGSRSAPGTGTGTGRKRARVSQIKRSSSSEEDDEAEEITSYSDIDCSPSKRPKPAPAPGQKLGTLSRRAAATKASATIAAATALADTSEGEDQDQNHDQSQEQDQGQYEADVRTPTVNSMFVLLDSPPTAASVRTRNSSIFGPSVEKKPAKDGHDRTSWGDLGVQPPPSYLFSEMADDEC